MKASEDIDFVDPNYVTNRAGATAAGLVVGAYHFAQPDAGVGDGAAEADHFIDTATPASRRPDPGPRPRAERRPVADRPERLGPRLPRARRRADRGPRRHLLLAELLEELHGRHDLVRQQRLRGAVGRPLDDRSRPDRARRGWGANGWTFWQYTSSGVVPGIAGRVDLNRYNGIDLAAVRIP